MTAYAALAEPHRREILDLLLVRERSVNELVAQLDLSQPGVSKHLKVLREAGLVDVHPHGRERRNVPGDCSRKVRISRRSKPSSPRRFSTSAAHASIAVQLRSGCAGTRSGVMKSNSMKPPGRSRGTRWRKAASSVDRGGASGRT